MPYIKEVFDVTTFAQAKNAVLSDDPKDPKKFEKETNFLIDVISKQSFMSLDENSVVFDFGCGMGRIAKELIHKFKCKVIGLDISDSMLLFAKLYTANLNKFNGCKSYSNPESVDVALSVFALQHAQNPKQEIDNIYNVLKHNGIFIMLNENKRFVPNGVDFQNYVLWDDDRFNVFEYTETKFTKIHSVPYLNTEKNILFYRKDV